MFAQLCDRSNRVILPLKRSFHLSNLNFQLRREPGMPNRIPGKDKISPPGVPNHVQRKDKNASSIMNYFSRDSRHLRYRRHDNAGPEWRLVYDSDMKYTMHMGQFVKFLMIIPIGLNVYHRFNRGETALEDPIFTTNLQAGFALAFLALFLLGCEMVVRRYPMRIYFNAEGKQYLISFMHPIYFNQTRGLIVNEKSLVQHGKMSGSFRHIDTGKKIALDSNKFVVPFYYVNLMK